MSSVVLFRSETGHLIKGLVLRILLFGVDIRVLDNSYTLA